MNRSAKEISDLTSGTHLDALVAESVFGWKWVRAKPTDWLTKGFGRDSCLANRLRQGMAFMSHPADITENVEVLENGWIERNILNSDYRAMSHEYPGWGFPKKYSSDISCAWEIQEKLKFNLFPNFHGCDGSGECPWCYERARPHWHASKGMCDDFGCSERCATAETAQLAICLAALKRTTPCSEDHGHDSSGP